MSDQLLGLRLFVRVARTKSFSLAAKELQLSQPTASRMITQLEEQLAVTLFARTTRAVTLTDAGRIYLEHVQRVLDALEEAGQAVRETSELRGSLRVGASSILTSRLIVPRLEQFTAQHPALLIALAVDDRRQNLVTEGVDVVLRVGRLDDSSAIARKLGTWTIVLGATPQYLGRHGIPKSTDDLRAHRAIFAGTNADGRWTLRDGRREVSLQMRPALSVSSSEVGINACLAGFGIAAGTHPILKPYFETGELVHVLPTWTLGTVDVHAVYPGGQAAKAAARAFTAWFAGEISVL